MQGQNKPVISHFFKLWISTGTQKAFLWFHEIIYQTVKMIDTSNLLSHHMSHWILCRKKLRQKHTKHTQYNWILLEFIWTLIYQNNKTRGPMDPGSLTWVLITRRGCLPQSLNHISPPPKSILGITPIITKTYQSKYTYLHNFNVRPFYPT